MNGKYAVFYGDNDIKLVSSSRTLSNLIHKMGWGKSDVEWLDDILKILELGQKETLFKGVFIQKLN